MPTVDPKVTGGRKTRTPEEMLREISQIRRMIQGRICAYTAQNTGRKYFNLSSYVGGKVTQHVPKDQRAALQRLIDKHKRFRRLVAQYEKAISRRTRGELGL